MSNLPMVILISASSLRDGESSIFYDLFDAGLQRLHIRKPDCKARDIAKILSSLPEVYHSRVVIHRFPELLKEFTVAGYHHYANEPLQEVPGTRSRSFHNLDELKQINEPLDYCFFGPVFESISKKGYVPKVSLPELGSVLFSLKKDQGVSKPLIYALGGVRRRKIPELLSLGFDGITLLGSIWGKKDPLEAFEKYHFIQRTVWGKKEKEKGIVQRLFGGDDS
jgi:thiamine-phosphate pyrophosphorylase